MHHYLVLQVRDFKLFHQFVISTFQPLPLSLQNGRGRGPIKALLRISLIQSTIQAIHHQSLMEVKK